MNLLDEYTLIVKINRTKEFKRGIYYKEESFILTFCTLYKNFDDYSYDESLVIFTWLNANIEYFGVTICWGAVKFV